METIIKQSADGIILSRDNNFDTNLGKVFINNHEITDIDTFFKVAEENTRLLEQCKKQKEVIDNAIEYIKNNVYEEDNGCGDYWWEIADKDELLKILQDKEVPE